MFLKLTGANVNLFLNFNTVECFLNSRDIKFGTEVYLKGGDQWSPLMVIETPEQIMEMLNETKLKVDNLTIEEIAKKLKQVDAKCGKYI